MAAALVNATAVARCPAPIVARSQRAKPAVMKPADRSQTVNKASLAKLAFGTIVSAQLALLPVAGPALADEARSNQPQQEAEASAAATQDRAPKNIFFAEWKPSKNAVKLDVLADRFNVDKLMSSGQTGGKQNIFNVKGLH